MTSTLGVLLLIFLTLKLAGVVAWSWLWVLCPLWLPFVGFAFLLFCAWSIRWLP